MNSQSRGKRVIAHLWLKKLSKFSYVLPKLKRDYFNVTGTDLA